MKKLTIVIVAILLSVSVAQAKAPATSGAIPLTDNGKWVLAEQCGTEKNAIPGWPGAVTMPDAACGSGGLARNGGAVTCKGVMKATCQLTLPTAPFKTCWIYGGPDGMTKANPGETVTLGPKGSGAAGSHVNCTVDE